MPEPQSQDLLRALFEEIKDRAKPDDKELKRFLKSDTGKEYVRRLASEKHPLGLFFLSKQLTDDRDQPYTMTTGALRADIYETAYPVEVANDNGDTVFAMSQGDKWLQVHVVEGSDKYIQLSPRERVKAFQDDLRELLNKLSRIETSDPQKSVTFDTPIIGISHLVRLFTPRSKQSSEQLIWNVGTSSQDAPDPVLDFFTNSSTEMSKAFGGGEANPDDIRVLCASARQLSGLLE